MRKLKAIFFLMLFLTSQVSFSLDLHFCHATLTDISFSGGTDCVCLDIHEGEHDNKCHSHKKSCDHSTKEVVAKKDCCSTQTLEHEHSDEVLATNKIAFEKFYMTHEAFTFQGLTFEVKQDILPENYIPPLLSRDLRVLVQSFQI